MKLVLFDCDGTLVDSGRLIHAVMARTFDDFGHRKPELAETKSIIGLTLDIAIARLLGRPHVDEEAIRMAARYKAVYPEVRGEPNMEVPLFDGIKDLIAKIAAKDDVLIGAVTGKSRNGLIHILEKHGFSKDFIVSRTADDCPSKPHPAMVTECCDETRMDARDTIVVGDAIYDMQMAKSAGAKAVGVSWGYASVDELKANGADAIIYRAEELLSHIE